MCTDQPCNVEMNWRKKYGDKVKKVQEQATPTYIPTCGAYLYSRSLNWSECICNAVKIKCTHIVYEKFLDSKEKLAFHQGCL